MPVHGGTPLSFACTCGKLTGHITAAGVASGTRVACFCPDCRAAELYFGQPDPAPGPVDIFQLSPDTVVIDSGKEHLALMQLGPKGLYRWYARCCNSPIGNTMKSPKIPFAGICVKRLSEPERLGPVISKGYVLGNDGVRRHENLRPALMAVLRRAISARLSGRWRKTPFFDIATGHPSARPTVLSKEERAALYP